MMRPTANTGKAATVAGPIRVFAQRLTYILLMITAVSLLVLGKADLVLMERVRTIGVDQAAPFLSYFSQPIASINRGIDRLRALGDLAAENELLRAENARLKQWQAVSRRLDQENTRLRNLMNAKRDPLVLPITARVISDSGGPFVKTLIINAGRRDGVRKGQAVLGEDGLIGRVAQVGERAARILLLTDLNSRVPVLLENSRQRAILTGDNTDRPKIEFLPANAQVSPGDRVVTSGDGGLLPPGRPIGVVSSVTEGGVRLQTYADWDRIEFVSVLRYDLPRLTRPDQNPGDIGESGLGQQ
ncbi:rod shape-determining protein MreC [Oceanibacterium hippocampi]|uniref:Cell shape-determining protein MreC n=1 Tax=Oceanibacterium hippocampi TaxID=745714 RepID=A0A1Y5TU57_9PROT|nr:rod shape-determining protein MreC [Oceanibacterium hippocampi]SLN72376.1 Cell shape-determining protein MreC [Oceanibacterium hippocampi]